MIRIYEFNNDTAYLHCYECGMNFDLTKEQLENWKDLECPNCNQTQSNQKE